jgi:magnesium transporter
MIIDCAHYKDGTRQHEGKIPLEQAAARAGEGTDDFVWIGLHDPEPGTLEELKDLFHLHELAVEDAEQTHGRPKIEDYDAMWFIVLKTAHYHEDREEVHFGEVHVFAGPGYAITVRHGPGSELSSARSRLEARPDLLKMGPAAVVWAVMDKVVDDYGPVVDGIEDDIEEVEVEVFDDDEPAPTERIYKLKREVIEFHRAIGPLIGPLDEIERGKYERIPIELQRFFRDVYDHARRADEQVSSQRELLNSVLEANLALSAVAQNEVIKRISSWVGIVAVPTFIASVYGMNFDHMPELHWRVGYPLAIGLMALSFLGLYKYFKRVNWL